jgi:hypothetical protein
MTIIGDRKENIAIEDLKMTEEQEKDNTWVIIGVCIAAIILLVVMLKKDETKHLQSGDVEALQQKTFDKIEARHKPETDPDQKKSKK